MRAYVETNFVLELAFRQEQVESCRAILDLCERGRIRLLLPAFSLAEAFIAFAARERERRRARESLDAQLKQLARSEVGTTRVEALQPLTAFLMTSIEEERSGLAVARERILRVAEVPPLDSDVLRAGAQFERALELSPQDALVLSSILRHLSRASREPSCFLNRNAKDFDVPTSSNGYESWGVG